MPDYTAETEALNECRKNLEMTSDILEKCIDNGAVKEVAQAELLAPAFNIIAAVIAARTNQGHTNGHMKKAFHRFKMAVLDLLEKDE